MSVVGADVVTTDGSVVVATGTAAEVVGSTAIAEVVGSTATAEVVGTTTAVVATAVVVTGVAVAAFEETGLEPEAPSHTAGPGIVYDVNDPYKLNTTPGSEYLYVPGIATPAGRVFAPLEVTLICTHSM